MLNPEPSCSTHCSIRGFFWLMAFGLGLYGWRALRFGALGFHIGLLGSGISDLAYNMIG